MVELWVLGLRWADERAGLWLGMWAAMACQRAVRGEHKGGAPCCTWAGLGGNDVLRELNIS